MEYEVAYRANPDRVAMATEESMIKGCDTAKHTIQMTPKGSCLAWGKRSWEQPLPRRELNRGGTCESCRFSINLKAEIMYYLYYKGKAQNASVWREQLESIIDYDVEHLGSNREDWIIKEVK